MLLQSQAFSAATKFLAWGLLVAIVFAAASVSSGNGAEASEPIVVKKQSRVLDARGGYAVREKSETWNAARTAFIVCDVWDAHHCLNAVRRVEEMAPRMNQVLEVARKRGATIIHAPSSCMDAYKDHPGRKLAQSAPKAANLPADIGQWCRHIPAEDQGKYPIDQTDGGEDDDPEEHRQWHEKLTAMGRNPRAPWKSQYHVVRIHDQDAISDSGVEIWNLLEQRKIDNVVLLGVHTNMCVLGRPFGLRQMAKNGKNVVLMRDMTDTMYNPERSPFVTHYVGTDLIVEHIEKFVCPTITSVDLVGGTPFRFKNDRRHIVMVIGDDEYKTEKTLPEFARTELEPRGFKVTVIHADDKDRNNFPGLVEAVEKADLLLISARRRTPKAEQLAAVRKFVASGKPVVGIRTASHAFSLRGNMPPPEGHGAWPELDAEVLGGNYNGHHSPAIKTVVTVAPGAEKHPVLRGIDVANWLGKGSLYKTAPLSKAATPLLMGTIPDHPVEPIAWTHRYHGDGSRVFYTSFGHWDDFQDPQFRKLLLNGICWVCELAAPGSPAAK